MPKKRFFVLGNDTLLGKTFVSRLTELGHTVFSLDSEDEDLTGMRYDFGIHAGGPTMGVFGNSKYPADLMTKNTKSALRFFETVPEGAKALYLASSCCYPAVDVDCQESMFGSGPLEPISSYYATAKIAAVKLCQAYRKQHNRRFISAVVTNVFGPDDDLSPEKSHVVTGMMSKVHGAMKRNEDEVVMSGSGKPVRELMCAADAVDACLFLLDNYEDDGVINVAGGDKLTIKSLAQLIALVVGYGGKFTWDTSRPDGAPHKALSCHKLRGLGWSHDCVSTVTALERTYEWFLAQERKQ